MNYFATLYILSMMYLLLPSFRSLSPCVRFSVTRVSKNSEVAPLALQVGGTC
jgi:hypothetical protein